MESVLRDILVRHGTALLGEQRRFEACIRDTSLSQREMNAALAALKSGIPAHFLQFQTSGLTTVAIANYSARLSEETGLDKDLARSTLEAWACALRVDVPTTRSPQEAPAEPSTRNADGKLKDAPTPKQESKEDATPHPAPDVAPAAGSARGADWLVWLLAALGFVLVAGQGFRNLPISFATYVTGSLCILVAALVLRQAAWIKWPGVVLCAFSLLLALFGMALLGVPAPPLILAGCLAVVGAIGLLLWRTGGLPQTAPIERTTIAVLLAALWRIFSFSMALGGIVWTVSQGYLFHPRFLWLWLNFPISLALVGLAWSTLAGRRANLPRLVVLLLLGASAVLGVADLIMLQAYDPNVRLPYFIRVMPILGIAADLAVAALIIFGRKHEDARPKETAIA